MKKLIALILALMLLCACGSPEAPAEGVLARVGEEYIYAETIEADRLLGIEGSDREMVEEKVLNMLMVLEAEALGLAATEAEIEEILASQEQAWQMASVQKEIEERYAPLGISFEEFKQMVTELAPNTVARVKLEKHYSQEYSDKNPFDPLSDTAEYAEAQNEYVEKQLEKLWTKYKGEYDIYID